MKPEVEFFALYERETGRIMEVGCTDSIAESEADRRKYYQNDELYGNIILVRVTQIEPVPQEEVDAEETYIQDFLDMWDRFDREREAKKKGSAPC